MKENKPKRIMRVCAKCSDMFTFHIGNESYSGYVPEWFPNPNPDEDYVRLNIDLDTGKILNWKKPTEKQLKDTFKNTDGG